MLRGAVAARMVLLLGMLVLSLASRDLVVIALLLAAAGGLLLAAGPGVRWRWLALAAGFALPFAVLNAALVGSDPLLVTGPVSFHREGWEAGLRFGGRGVLAAALGLWMLATTHPREAAAALQRWPTLAVAAAGTLRFAPLAAQDWRRIREAQALRGHAMRTRWRSAAADAVPLLVPLFVATVRRGRALQEALDAAAFGSGPRTQRAGAKWRWNDAALACLGALLMAVAFLQAVPR